MTPLEAASQLAASRTPTWAVSARKGQASPRLRQCSGMTPELSCIRRRMRRGRLNAGGRRGGWRASSGGLGGAENRTPRPASEPVHRQGVGRLLGRPAGACRNGAGVRIPPVAPWHQSGPRSDSTRQSRNDPEGCPCRASGRCRSRRRKRTATGGRSQARWEALSRESSRRPIPRLVAHPGLPGISRRGSRFIVWTAKWRAPIVTR
jgi:hypothetical protein